MQKLDAARVLRLRRGQAEASAPGAEVPLLRGLVEEVPAQGDPGVQTAPRFPRDSETQVLQPLGSIRL